MLRMPEGESNSLRTIHIVQGRGRDCNLRQRQSRLDEVTATGPSCGKSIHVPHLRALRGCSLVSSKLLKSRKSAACPETPSVTLLFQLNASRINFPCSGFTESM